MSLLDELSFFLRLQVHQTKDNIFLFHTKYLRKIFRKFGMEDCKPICKPMVIGCNLSKDDKYPVVNQYEYKSMIGILLYLIGTRPNIMHVVGIIRALSI